MSVKNMSDSVVRHILDGVYAKVQEGIKNQNILLDAKKTLEFKDPDLRAITGKNQLGVISDRGLKLLSEQFNRAATRSTTFDKLIKEDIENYRAYPTIYNYLKQNEDSSRTILIGLASKASTVLSKQKLIEDFFNYYNKTFTSISTQSYTDQSGNLTGFTASTTEHAQFNKQFKQFLLQSSVDPIVVDFIDANTDAGHLLGVFNIKFAKLLDLDIKPNSGSTSFTISSIRPFAASTQEEQDSLKKITDGFQKSLELLAEADVLTGNLLSDITIDIDASKQVYGNLGAVSAVEIQLSNLNQRAGNRLTAIGRKLNDLQRAAYLSKTQQGGRLGDFKIELAKLFKSFEGLYKYIQKISALYSGPGILNAAERAISEDIRKRSDEIFQTLINTSGSDSIATAIDKTVFNPLRGLPQPKEQKTKIPKLKTRLGKAVSDSKKVPKLSKPKVKKPVVPTVKKVVRFNVQSLTDLDSLLTQINANLHDQIRRNMGTGDRRDVLNYRTGRFAQSVRVERMSESRQGMITAFYSYMKNPYATFSEGGRQQYPRSRDPKLLISKSIRELAGSVVANRMRAVNI